MIASLPATSLFTAASAAPISPAGDATDAMTPFDAVLAALAFPAVMPVRQPALPETSASTMRDAAVAEAESRPLSPTTDADDGEPADDGAEQVDAARIIPDLAGMPVPPSLPPIAADASAAASANRDDPFQPAVRQTPLPRSAGLFVTMSGGAEPAAAAVAPVVPTASASAETVLLPASVAAEPVFAASTGDALSPTPTEQAAAQAFALPRVEEGASASVPPAVSLRAGLLASAGGMPSVAPQSAPADPATASPVVLADPMQRSGITFGHGNDGAAFPATPDPARAPADGGAVPSGLASSPVAYQPTAASGPAQTLAFDAASVSLSPALTDGGIAQPASIAVTEAREPAPVGDREGGALRIGGLDLQAMFALTSVAPSTVSVPQDQPFAPVTLPVDDGDPAQPAGAVDPAQALVAAVLPAPVQRAGGEAATAQPVQAPAEANIQHHLDVAHDGAWLDRLARDIALSADREGHMRFQLNPERLGALTVDIRRAADGASVRFTADSEAARQLIADAQPRLAAEARAQGMRIADTQVDLSGGNGGQGSWNGGGAANSFGQGQQQGQQQGGQRGPLFERASRARVSVAGPAQAAAAERYA